MPTCHLLAVCQGSSLDQSTNNWSIFGLVEQVQVRSFPAALPFEVHSHWRYEPDENGCDFEFRIAMISPSAGQVFSDPITVHARNPRHRIRAAGLPPISGPGNYEITMEWRSSGTANWTRCGHSWPLTVQQVEQLPTPGEQLH